MGRREPGSLPTQVPAVEGSVSAAASARQGSKGRKKEVQSPSLYFAL